MNKINIEQDEDWKKIVLQLRDIAKEQGITQDVIALRAGMLQHSISRIFSLNFTPKLNTVIIIAKAIGVEITVSEPNKNDQDESK
jgi:DNA-binding phage protein